MRRLVVLLFLAALPAWAVPHVHWAQTFGGSGDLAPGPLPHDIGDGYMLVISAASSCSISGSLSSPYGGSGSFELELVNAQGDLEMLGVQISFVALEYGPCGNSNLGETMAQTLIPGFKNLMTFLRDLALGMLHGLVALVWNLGAVVWAAITWVGASLARVVLLLITSLAAWAMSLVCTALHIVVPQVSWVAWASTLGLVNLYIPVDHMLAGIAIWGSIMTVALGYRILMTFVPTAGG